MKTLIFIILKIAEILLIGLTYLGLCYGGSFLDKLACNSSGAEPMKDYGLEFYLACPFLSIAVLAILLLIVMIVWGLSGIIPDWIEANKEWSNNIHKRLFKK